MNLLIPALVFHSIIVASQSLVRQEYYQAFIDADFSGRRLERKLVTSHPLEDLWQWGTVKKLQQIKQCKLISLNLLDENGPIIYSDSFWKHRIRTGRKIK